MTVDNNAKYRGPNEPLYKSISARCPVCSEHFDEQKGVDVEKGEVCCTEQCATDFEANSDLYVI